MIKTDIISNGSKWAGESPDTIDKLLEVLKDNTIEERFFTKYGLDSKGNLSSNSQVIHEYKNMCPIDEDYKNHVFQRFRDEVEEGTYHFFGNFEEVSHVFSITTNDSEIINKLVSAIKANKGWIKYYELHKVKQ